MRSVAAVVRDFDAPESSKLDQAARGGERPSRRRLKVGAQIGAGLALFAIVLLAVSRDWRNVHATLSRISAWELVLSELLVLAGLSASVLVWQRSLRELGSSVRVADASKIYLIGQLGKYLPGSVWAFFAQMELAHKAGAPRSRSFAASVVAVCINLVTGLALGTLVIPSVTHGEAWRYGALVALFLVLIAGLSPPVLTRLVDLLMRVVRRPPLERSVSWNGMLVGSGWSLGSWAAYGLSLWVLAVGVGAPAGKSLPLCLAGVALAMTAGFVVVVAPSGIGVREAVLVAALAPVLTTSAALAVALVLRLLFTLGDLVAAAAVTPIRIRPAQLRAR
jgi:glycosyltransferase 2 family protein